MKKITLQGIYDSLTKGTEEVTLTKEVMDKARLSIERMIGESNKAKGERN
jgi:quinolinate synthase